MIPDEAVEAAAKVMFEHKDREVTFREVARAALEAAAPHLMAAAWDEGFAADDFEVSIGMDRNPYRKPTDAV